MPATLIEASATESTILPVDDGDVINHCDSTEAQHLCVARDRALLGAKGYLRRSSQYDLSATNFYLLLKGKIFRMDELYTQICELICCQVQAPPAGHFTKFPVKVRWELIRRNPYYLTHWKRAWQYYVEPPVANPMEMALRRAAMLVLAELGFPCKPINPKLEPNDQFTEAVTDPALLASSVQPINYRTLALGLLGLPPEERAAIADYLLAANSQSANDVNANPLLQPALEGLLRHRSEALDAWVASPYFLIHVASSEATIQRDMKTQLNVWKKRKNLGSAKIHEGKLEKYLKVWDRREGWVCGEYNRSAEKTLKSIAQELKLGSVSTAFNHYKSGFEMIVGLPFTTELWMKILLPFKFRKGLNGPAESGRTGAFRQFRSPVERPVPDSVISSQSKRVHQIGMVEALSSTESEITKSMITIDIKDLLKRGFTDDEIGEKLELPNLEEIQYLRSRFADFRTS